MTSYWRFATFSLIWGMLTGVGIGYMIWGTA